MPDKFAFLKTHGPFSTSFNRTRFFTDIVAVEQIAHFQAQQVSRSEPRWLESSRLSRRQKVRPEIRRLTGRHIQFIAKFAAVSGSSHEAGYYSRSAFTAMVQF